MWVEAWLSTKKRLIFQLLQPPSVQMNEDVRNIAATYRQALKSLKPPAKSAMSTPANRTGKRVQIVENSTHHEIGHDHEGKALRKVK